MGTMDGLRCHCSRCNGRGWEVCEDECHTDDHVYGRPPVPCPGCVVCEVCLAAGCGVAERVRMAWARERFHGLAASIRGESVAGVTEPQKQEAADLVISGLCGRRGSGAEGSRTPDL